MKKLPTNFVIGTDSDGKCPVMVKIGVPLPATKKTWVEYRNDKPVKIHDPKHALGDRIWDYSANEFVDRSTIDAMLDMNNKPIIVGASCTFYKGDARSWQYGCNGKRAITEDAVVSKITAKRVTIMTDWGVKKSVKPEYLLIKN